MMSLDGVWKGSLQGNPVCVFLEGLSFRLFCLMCFFRDVCGDVFVSMGVSVAESTGSSLSSGHVSEDVGVSQKMTVGDFCGSLCRAFKGGCWGCLWRFVFATCL